MRLAPRRVIHQLVLQRSETLLFVYLALSLCTHDFLEVFLDYLFGCLKLLEIYAQQRGGFGHNFLNFGLALLD